MTAGRPPMPDINTDVGECLVQFSLWKLWRRWSVLVNSSDYLKCQIFSKSFGVGRKDPNSALLTTFFNKIKAGTLATKSSNVLFTGISSSVFLKIWGSSAPRAISLKNLVAPSLGCLDSMVGGPVQDFSSLSSCGPSVWPRTTPGSFSSLPQAGWMSPLRPVLSGTPLLHSALQGPHPALHPLLPKACTMAWNSFGVEGLHH